MDWGWVGLDEGDHVMVHQIRYHILVDEARGFNLMDLSCGDVYSG